MLSTRREFIKQLGIALASLAMARCAPRTRAALMEGQTREAVKTTEPVPTERSVEATEPVPTEQAVIVAPEGLLDIWQQFDALAAETRQDAGRGEQMKELLVAGHRAALDNQVALGELSEAVAERIQVAFEAAAGHIWMANAPVTCYEPVWINYRPVSSDQLILQAEILAGRTDLDPQVSAQAQDTIARDIAFLNLSPDQKDALYQRLMDGHQGGLSPPAFEDVDLDLAPEDLQAAQFLVDLLLNDAP
jgi:hypothetical protein